MKNGNLVGKLYPNGLDAIYNYDNFNRLAGLNSSANSCAYTYDPAGIRTAFWSAMTCHSFNTGSMLPANKAGTSSRTPNLLGSGNNESTTEYVYDQVNQLISEKKNVSGNEAYLNTFSFDPAGSRLHFIHDEPKTVKLLRSFRA